MQTSSIKIAALVFCVSSIECLAQKWVPLIEQIDKFPNTSSIKDPEVIAKINEKKNEFEIIKQLPELERIIKLSTIVGGRGGNDILQNDIHAYKFRTAREMLTSFPHPAETLVKWMEEQRSLRFRQTEEDKRGIRRHEKDADYRPSLVFSTIAQIPSAESVAVLGRYLSDKRDEKEMIGFGGGFSGGHFRYAAEALNYMGLKNAPTRQESFSTEDDHIQKWQQWFAEVEAGTRSFSFYGSDVEYRLKERADAEGRKHFVGESAAITSNKRNPAESESVATTRPTLSAWKTVALAISSLLLLLGAWLSLRKRRAAN